MLHRSSIALALTVVGAALTGCTDDPGRAAPIGEAFIGPITVELRDELAPGAKVVAKARHGERVDIIQTRRRFVKVRTPDGKEGWTDTRKLLTPEQMDELAELGRRAAKLPAMAQATVYDTLNMHAAPDRYSTSFYQITPGVKVDVLAEKPAPRTAQPPPAPPLIKPKPKPVKKVKPRAEPKVPPIPKPPAPKVPENWLELSKSPFPDEPREEAAEPKLPVRIDDWTFVRTPNGKAGWVLSRMLRMAIPDEVAQYSEGARITSYFALGTVQDELHGRKTHWLWTTTRKTGVPFQFDSFRVFIWNARRHRYETSYIERDLEGYYPIEVEGPKFSVLLRREDGGFYRKTFQLEGYLTRWLGNSEAKAPDFASISIISRNTPGSPAPAPPAAEKPGLLDRVKKLLKRS